MDASTATCPRPASTVTADLRDRRGNVTLTGDASTTGSAAPRGLALGRYAVLVTDAGTVRHTVKLR